MEENRTQGQEAPQQEVPKFRGLYRYVHISVKALDAIIITCVAVIILVTLFSLRDAGYRVTFDSRGGTDVAAEKYQYGDHIQLPEPPTREGYTFGGWYLDTACNEPLTEAHTVGGELILYAKWIPNP